MSGLRYHRTAARPEAVLALPDGIDVTTGYTFSLKIGRDGTPAIITKTTNITGGVGQVTVAWTAGELAALDADTLYTVQLTASTGGLARVYETTLKIDGVIT